MRAGGNTDFLVSASNLSVFICGYSQMYGKKMSKNLLV